MNTLNTANQIKSSNAYILEQLNKNCDIARLKLLIGNNIGNKIKLLLSYYEPYGANETSASYKDSLKGKKIVDLVCSENQNTTQSNQPIQNNTSSLSFLFDYIFTISDRINLKPTITYELLEALCSKDEEYYKCLVTLENYNNTILINLMSNNSNDVINQENISKILDSFNSSKERQINKFINYYLSERLCLLEIIKNLLTICFQHLSPVGAENDEDRYNLIINILTTNDIPLIALKNISDINNISHSNNKHSQFSYFENQVKNQFSSNHLKETSLLLTIIKKYYIIVHEVKRSKPDLKYNYSILNKLIEEIENMTHIDNGNLNINEYQSKVFLDEYRKEKDKLINFTILTYISVYGVCSLSLIDSNDNTRNKDISCISLELFSEESNYEILNIIDKVTKLIEKNSNNKVLMLPLLILIQKTISVIENLNNKSIYKYQEVKESLKKWNLSSQNSIDVANKLYGIVQISHNFYDELIIFNYYILKIDDLECQSSHTNYSIKVLKQINNKNYVFKENSIICKMIEYAIKQLSINFSTAVSILNTLKESYKNLLFNKLNEINNIEVEVANTCFKNNKLTENIDLPFGILPINTNIMVLLKKDDHTSKIRITSFSIWNNFLNFWTLFNDSIEKYDISADFGNYKMRSDFLKIQLSLITNKINIYDFYMIMINNSMDVPAITNRLNKLLSKSIALILSFSNNLIINLKYNNYESNKQFSTYSNSSYKMSYNNDDEKEVTEVAYNLIFNNELIMKLIELFNELIKEEQLRKIIFTNIINEYVNKRNGNSSSIEEEQYSTLNLILDAMSFEEIIHNKYIKYLYDDEDNKFNQNSCVVLESFNFLAKLLSSDVLLLMIFSESKISSDKNNVIEHNQKYTFIMFLKECFIKTITKYSQSLFKNLTDLFTKSINLNNNDSYHIAYLKEKFGLALLKYVLIIIYQLLNNIKIKNPLNVTRFKENAKDDSITSFSIECLNSFPVVDLLINTIKVKPNLDSNLKNSVNQFSLSISENWNYKSNQNKILELENVYLSLSNCLLETKIMHNIIYFSLLNFYTLLDLTIQVYGFEHTRESMEGRRDGTLHISSISSISEISKLFSITYLVHILQNLNVNDSRVEGIEFRFSYLYTNITETYRFNFLILLLSYVDFKCYQNPAHIELSVMDMFNQYSTQDLNNMTSFKTMSHVSFYKNKDNSKLNSFIQEIINENYDDNDLFIPHLAINSFNKCLEIIDIIHSSDKQKSCISNFLYYKISSNSNISINYTYTIYKTIESSVLNFKSNLNTSKNPYLLKYYELIGKDILNMLTSLAYYQPNLCFEILNKEIIANNNTLQFDNLSNTYSLDYNHNSNKNSLLAELVFTILSEKKSIKELNNNFLEILNSLIVLFSQMLISGHVKLRILCKKSVLTLKNLYYDLLDICVNQYILPFINNDAKLIKNLFDRNPRSSNDLMLIFPKFNGFFEIILAINNLITFLMFEVNIFSSFDSDKKDHNISQQKNLLPILNNYLDKIIQNGIPLFNDLVFQSTFVISIDMIEEYSENLGISIDFMKHDTLVQQNNLIRGNTNDLLDLSDFARRILSIISLSDKKYEEQILNIFLDLNKINKFNSLVSKYNDFMTSFNFLIDTLSSAGKDNISGISSYFANKETSKFFNETKHTSPEFFSTYKKSNVELFNINLLNNLNISEYSYVYFNLIQILSEENSRNNNKENIIQKLSNYSNTLIESTNNGFTKLFSLKNHFDFFSIKKNNIALLNILNETLFEINENDYIPEHCLLSNISNNQFVNYFKNLNTELDMILKDIFSLSKNSNVYIVDKFSSQSLNKYLEFVLSSLSTLNKNSSMQIIKSINKDDLKQIDDSIKEVVEENLIIFVKNLYLAYKLLPDKQVIIVYTFKEIITHFYTLFTNMDKLFTNSVIMEFMKILTISIGNKDVNLELYIATIEFIKNLIRLFNKDAIKYIILNTSLLYTFNKTFGKANSLLGVSSENISDYSYLDDSNKTIIRSSDHIIYTRILDFYILSIEQSGFLLESNNENSMNDANVLQSFLTIVYEFIVINFDRMNNTLDSSNSIEEIGNYKNKTLCYLDELSLIIRLIKTTCFHKAKLYCNNDNFESKIHLLLEKIALISPK